MGMLLVGTAIALGAPAPKDPLPKDDKLVGEWVVQSIQQSGKAEQLGDEPVRHQFTADGKWLIYHGDIKFGGDGRRYTINPKASPPTIDLDPAPDSKKLQPLPGIYKIDGDKLIVCHARTSKGQRPGSFESTAESATTLYVFKRVTPKE